MQTPPNDPRLDVVLRRGAEIWRDWCVEHEGLFHRVIPADHALAIEALRTELPRAHSFLELGSATGVVTILADLLGFDAYGIEIEPRLVDVAEALAEEVESRATFAQGTFVPTEYKDEVSLLESDYLTPTEGADAYEELGLDLGDFDLVYAYPWPGEEDWLIEMVRRCAGPSTRLMLYTVRDGFEVLEPDA